MTVVGGRHGETPKGWRALVICPARPRSWREAWWVFWGCDIFIGPVPVLKTEVSIFVAAMVLVVS